MLYSVEKEVAADSKEAKSFLHMQSLEKKRQPISLTTGSPQQEPLNKKTLAGYIRLIATPTEHLVKESVYS